jgi:hypothetical protein
VSTNVPILTFKEDGHDVIFAKRHMREFEA